ncbi:MAG: hypothetical protein SV775_14865, partial [Thermodesulfobacteriota bacterium]|nr:hypothetical protein [Thermodesulfobacteriota bacterium]
DYLILLRRLPDASLFNKRGLLFIFLELIFISGCPVIGVHRLMWGFSVNFASPFFTLYFLRELRFSFTLVAVLGTLSAFADLTGIQLWGRISDRVKNKAVIQFSSWVAIFLPIVWVTVRPGSLFMPIILHNWRRLLGGDQPLYS